MKVFKNRAVVFVMVLFFVTVVSCGKEEEGRKVDLDKKTLDVGQLVKTIDMEKSLKFCFNRRLAPREEVNIQPQRGWLWNNPWKGMKLPCLLRGQG
ncbi:MAG: hypothetical protein Q7J15_11895 [Candidatus Desulfaltia sp.]|nr:hypothetical protein [Candidatus Desulfaltia sp.]